MQLSRPMRVVSAALDAEVLAVLAVADGGFSGRQVAKMVPGSVEGVRRTLGRLVAQGIVTREALGSGIIFRFNREHLAADAVVALATLRLEFFRRLQVEVDAWSTAAAFVAVFGSVARGNDENISDVDIFVVRAAGDPADDPAWRAQLDGLASAVTRWTGNDARILEFSIEDLRDPETAAEPVLEEVLRDGVSIAGSPAVLRRAAQLRRA